MSRDLVWKRADYATRQCTNLCESALNSRTRAQHLNSPQLGLIGQPEQACCFFANNKPALASPGMTCRYACATMTQRNRSW